MALYLRQKRIEEPIWLEPTDIAFLQNGITEREAQVEAIDCEIASLEVQITYLMRQKEARLVEIAAARNILAPIRRVPLEILAQIIELVCLTNDDHRHVVESTYKISAVCAAWREAAFYAISSIWSTVHLCFDDSPKTFQGADVWLREWIPRSRGMPLEFYLDFTSPDMSGRKYDPQKNAQLLEYILEHHERIRVLHLAAYPNLYRSLFHNPCLARWPLLEDLSLEIIGKWDDSTDALHLPRMIGTFSDSPKLRTVKIKEAGANTDTGGSILGRLALPFDQLTALNIDASYSASIFDPAILQHCQNLASLVITQPFDGCLQPSEPLHLPMLKSLHISCRRTTGDLLQYLTLPILEDLVLHNNGQVIGDVARDVVELQIRSVSRLSSLTLSGFRLDAEDTESVTAMLDVFPNIRSLTVLGFRSDVGPLLGALILDQGQYLLPNLSTLGLGCKKVYRTLWTPPLELALMIRSRRREESVVNDRWKEFAPLQKVTLYGIDLQEESLNLLKHPGLAIDFV